MIAIKPGIFNHYFKRFTKEMIKEYFKKLRPDQGEIKINQLAQKVEPSEIIKFPHFPPEIKIEKVDSVSPLKFEPEPEKLDRSPLQS